MGVWFLTPTPSPYHWVMLSTTPPSTRDASSPRRSFIPMILEVHSHFHKPVRYDRTPLEVPVTTVEDHSSSSPKQEERSSQTEFCQRLQEAQTQTSLESVSEATPMVEHAILPQTPPAGVASTCHLPPLDPLIFSGNAADFAAFQSRWTSRYGSLPESLQMEYLRSSLLPQDQSLLGAAN